MTCLAVTYLFQIKKADSIDEKENLSPFSETDLKRKFSEKRIKHWSRQDKLSRGPSAGQQEYE